MSSVFEAGATDASLQRLRREGRVAGRGAIHDLASAPDARPFPLVASFSHTTHGKRHRHWNRYEGVKIDHRGSLIPDDIHPHTRRVREMCGGIGVDVPEDVILNARRGHYASISWLDDTIADLVGRLEAEGGRDDTVIVLMADHGEMLGERGDWYKMSFFEPAVTVPLIVSAPRHFAPERVSGSVSLLDLVPTILELAGVECDNRDALDGHSLVGPPSAAG
jgi:choline-sulfatase